MPLTAAFAAALLTLAAAPQAAPDPVAEFEVLCLMTRGEDAAIEAAALARGYTPTQSRYEEEFDGQPHNPRPRVWSRTDDGVETRVISDEGRLYEAGPFQPAHGCTVSAPGEPTDARAALVACSGVDPFRDGRSFIFAWTEGPDGPVSLRQRDYERRREAFMRDHGLQVIRVSGFRKNVILSYVTAAD